MTASLRTVGSPINLLAGQKHGAGSDRDSSETTEITETTGTEEAGAEITTEASEVGEVDPRQLYRGTNPGQEETSQRARWDASQSLCSTESLLLRNKF